MNLPESIIIVLHRPQKLANIAGAVRALKNMGLRRLRLVQPADYDPAAVEGIAHRSADLLAAVTVHSSLDAALADAVYIVGTTARQRATSPRVSTPRALAPELLARAAEGPVALVFGPEDNGLTSAELDRCHCILTIPTDPAYASLNLAQAVLIVAYELRLASEQNAPLPTHRTRQPASAAQLEALFEALERALWGIEFFKTRRATGIMRTLRALVHRAEPDAREAALLQAMALETLHFLRRKGIAVEVPNRSAAEGTSTEGHTGA